MVKAKLVSWTNEPIKTIYWAFMNMHNPIPDSLDEVDISGEELESFMDMLCKQPHQTVFEFVNTVWKFDDVSRAFQQQLTRSRQASYSIQSLRIVDVGNFADNHAYRLPEDIEEGSTDARRFHGAMVEAQDNYRELINKGVSVQAARGVLPLNIHSPITMAINLRSLYHMSGLRFCENTQGEFKEVALQMKEEVEKKMHPILAKPMKPLCIDIGKCLSPVPCDKYDFPKAIKMDVSRWIKG